MGKHNKLHLIGYSTETFVVIAEDKRKYYWVCLCNCGKKFIDEGWRLKSGKKISCGCLNYRNHKNAKYEDPSTVSWKSLYKRYRNNSKWKKKIFSLSLEEFISLCQSKCSYCDCPPSQYYNVYKTTLGRYTTKNIERANRAQILYNGIDRIDSKGTYNINNCCACCTKCNYAKRTMTVEEFIEHIRKIYNHICQKK